MGAVRNVTLSSRRGSPPKSICAAGTPNEVVDTIGRYAELGVTRIYLQMLDLTDIDHLELVASKVVSQFARS